MNDDHGDEFYMLIDLLLYYPFTSLWPPFRNLLPDTQHRFTHACTADFFFFFLLGRKTDTARRRRTAGDE